MTIHRIQEMARKENLDGIIVSSFQNVCYLSGAVISTQNLIPQRLAAVVATTYEQQPTLVVCTIEESLVAKESKIQDIRGYEEFNESPIAVIAEVARAKGLAHGTIGVEKKALTASDYEQLCGQLPGARFVGINDLLDRMRMIKTPAEIEHLRAISLATDHAIRHAYEAARIGATEIDVLHTLVSDLIQSGAEELPFLCLGAGPNEAYTHPYAGDYTLAEGDIIGCDVGGKWRGYFSDLARVAVIGKATCHQEEQYRKLWEIHEETIAAIRPGLRASELYWRCVDSFKQKGLTLSLSHIGHSLGLTLHEQPMLCPTDHTELQEGMVLAVEPATVDATGKYHTEDLIEVTALGPRLLSRSADWSRLLVVD